VKVIDGAQLSMVDLIVILSEPPRKPEPQQDERKVRLHHFP
jgi:hypothetical protein